MQVATETQIKASDLRIGNWVLHEGKMYRVIWRDLGFEKVNFEPIPLTPEILEKAGFSDFNKDEKYFIGRFKLVKEKDNYRLSQSVSSVYLPVANKIQYLHQLQNIIHSITGQELTINL
jgi:hypothetical protein